MSRLRARLTLRSETEAQIDFSAFIPAILDLPMRINPSRSPFERNSPDTLKRARRVARRNYGQSPVELPNAVKTHESILKSISCVPGLVEIAQSNPYRIHFKFGGLFDAAEIAQTLGNLLTHHFYHGEELTWMESVFAKPSESDF